MDVDQFLPLTTREFHVLLTLAAEPLNGYQVSKRAEENSRGAVSLSPATQYTVLHRLVGRGLIIEDARRSEAATSRRGQRFWTLTPLGRRVLTAEAYRMQADARLALALAEEE